MRPSAEQIPARVLRAEVDRIVASQTFHGASRLVRFLRYVVEQVIEGRAEGIKEYSIGVEVFDRGASFDPRTDSVVRVEARRLRSKLLRYYETEGADSPVIISVPKGSYVPVFAAGGPASAPSRPPPAWLPLLGWALAILVAVWGTVILLVPSLRAPARSVVVLPLENLSANQANGYFCDALAHQVASRLAADQRLRVVTRGPSGPYEARADLRELARTHGARYVLEGSAAFSENRVRVTVMLVDLRNYNNVWTESYERETSSVLAAESDLASAVAAAVRARLE